jgi:hypothetical protein
MLPTLLANLDFAEHILKHVRGVDVLMLVVAGASRYARPLLGRLRHIQTEAQKACAYPSDSLFRYLHVAQVWLSDDDSGAIYMSPETHETDDGWNIRQTIDWLLEQDPLHIYSTIISCGVVLNDLQHTYGETCPRYSETLGETLVPPELLHHARLPKVCTSRRRMCHKPNNACMVSQGGHRCAALRTCTRCLSGYQPVTLGSSNMLLTIRNLKVLLNTTWLNDDDFRVRWRFHLYQLRKIAETNGYARPVELWLHKDQVVTRLKQLRCLHRVACQMLGARRRIDPWDFDIVPLCVFMNGNTSFVRSTCVVCRLVFVRDLRVDNSVYVVRTRCGAHQSVCPPCVSGIVGQTLVIPAPPQYS